MYKPIILNKKIIVYDYLLLSRSLNFKIDQISLLFAILTSFIWLTASIFASSYMKHEHKKNRFFAFWLICLGANLGVVITGDLFSLFIFFEILGFAAYPLIIHEENEESLKAGTKYLFMTIFGGLSLLFGILFYASYGGLSLEIVPSLAKLQDASISVKVIISFLMITGFGVKAGMIPVHIWLPDAHPAAPSPASALLSGVMIKAGAYGIFRVLFSIFRPPEANHESIEIEKMWASTSQLGSYLIWIAIVTMFLGVIMALLQENSKRMLAYHSISQMGYILLGFGIGAYLGEEGVLGWSGGIYHLVNHALFKACLFLAVGAVFYRTGELNMYKLGGLWRKMPFTALFCFIAAFGISGYPFFNGFISKSLLHHAVIESSSFANLGGVNITEIFFILTGAGTITSFIKLTIFTFTGKMPDKYSNVKEAPLWQNMAMLFLVVFIIILGLFPQLILKTFIYPVLHLSGFAEKPVEHLVGFQAFTAENFMGIIECFLVGLVLYFIGTKYGLFHLHFPKWFGVDFWYSFLARSFLKFSEHLYIVYKGISQILFNIIRLNIYIIRNLIEVWRRLYNEMVLVFILGDAKGFEDEISNRIVDALSSEFSQDDLSVIKKASLNLSHSLNQIRQDITLKKPIKTKGLTLDEELPSDKMGLIQNTFSQLSSILGKEKIELVLERFQIEYRRARDKYHKIDQTIFEKIDNWITGMVRITVELLMEERIPWTVEKYISEQEITNTRKAIYQYTRDFSLNVFIIVLVFLVFLLVLIQSNNLINL